MRDYEKYWREQLGSEIVDKDMPHLKKRHKWVKFGIWCAIVISWLWSWIWLLFIATQAPGALGGMACALAMGDIFSGIAAFGIYGIVVVGV